LPEAFIIALQIELEKNVTGISEYDLITSLKEQGYFDFIKSPALPHELFRAHFLLFHALYLLRDKFLKNKQYQLDIHVLNVELLPYAEGKQELQQVDKLRDYYLDISNLDSTSENDVYDLLASFWNGYDRFKNRDEALAELGLKDPVDNKIIKDKYRKLVMQYHPDRGGDTEKLQKLNDVIKLLLN
jgi:hypothetical protein